MSESCFEVWVAGTVEVKLRSDAVDDEIFAAAYAAAENGELSCETGTIMGDRDADD